MIQQFQPYFLGIGAQKSATSWISKCLNEHPDICVALSKETHFFSDDKRFSQGIEHYKLYFTNCCNKNIHKGEYSTTYLFSKFAPQRICNMYPDVKLIVSLRNPVDRAISHIKHLISKLKNN